MDFWFLLNAVIIPFLFIFGLVGIVGCFILYTRKRRRELFDHLVLMNMIYNVAVLLSLVCAISLPYLYQHIGVHSITHDHLFGFFKFMVSFGVGGSAGSIGILCVDRYTILYHPHFHKRLSVKMMAIIVTILSFLNSIDLLLEFEVFCYKDDDDNDEGIITEDLLGLCEDGEKTSTYSQPRLSDEARTLKNLFAQGILPFCVTFLFYYKNCRSDICSNPEYDLTKKTMIAVTLVFLTLFSQVVPISWEVYDTFRKEPYYWQPMPAWARIWYSLSHFLAILPPTLYAYIFYGREFLSCFYKAVTDDEEALINEENIEEDNVETTHV